jgi:hypothetical protein
MKNKLMVFERKVLRKIFGPTKEMVHGESKQTMNYVN